MDAAVPKRTKDSREQFLKKQLKVSAFASALAAMACIGAFKLLPISTQNLWGMLWLAIFSFGAVAGYFASKLLAAACFVLVFALERRFSLLERLSHYRVPRAAKMLIPIAFVILSASNLISGCVNGKVIMVSQRYHLVTSEHDMPLFLWSMGWWSLFFCLSAVSLLILLLRNDR